MVGVTRGRLGPAWTGHPHSRAADAHPGAPCHLRALKSSQAACADLRAERAASR